MTFRSYSHCVISARSRRSAHSRLCGHRLDAGEGMGRPDPGVRCALPDPHLMRVDCRLTLTSADAVRGCPPAARAIRRAASYPRLGALHRRPAQHPHCPQRCGRGRHLHGLHARGREILEELFAGFTAALEARGAERGDVLRDIRRQLSGHQLAQADIGLPACWPAGRSSKATCGPWCGGCPGSVSWRTARWPEADRVRGGTKVWSNELAAAMLKLNR